MGARIRRSLPVLACAWLAAGVASAGTLTVTLGTGVLSGTAGALAFDFIDGDGVVDNTVTLTAFSSDGVFEPGDSTGGVSGNVSGTATFTDAEFFNELLVPITFGSTVSFSISYTNVAGTIPDSFAVLVLDPAAVNSLVTTDLSADALVAIDLNGDATSVSLATATDPAVTVAPEPSSLALFLLAGTALAGLVTRRSIATRS
jgi:hypothetical protein